jgi:hypothetical protein
MGYRLKRFLTGCRHRLRAGARCRGAVGADTAPSGLASWDIAARIPCQPMDAGGSAEARRRNCPAAALSGGETRAITASSSMLSTVERELRRPVGKSAGAGALFPLRGRLRIDPIALGQRRQTVQTSLDRAPDNPRRRGASMQYLAHSTSFYSDDEVAPSKPGIKHIGRVDNGDSQSTISRLKIESQP